MVYSPFKKCLFGALFFTTALTAYETLEDLRETPYLNPDLAARKTAKIRLDNGLEAYLISDPSSEDAGAALTVKVGSWDEPKEAEGLAHFLEHMLFMGTEKYPVESEYDSYLSKYRGMSNAFTYSDITAYMFSVKQEGFEGALDRYASFFKSPLFNPSGVEREVKAIDQEFKMNAEKDSFLRLQVMKELSNPEHPFSRFNSGNKDSLKDVSQEELKAWYQSHYSADRMRLWIFSPLPLGKLEALVEEKFGSIPVREVEESIYTDALLNPDRKGKLIKLRPIQEERLLSVVWELPKELSIANKEQPWSQIGWVLGSEGEGSLLSELKKEGLAQGLSAGDLALSASKRLFFVDVQLTPAGEKEWKTVLKRVFQAINLLKKEGISEPLFNTIQSLQKQAFQWGSPKDVFSEAMNQAFIQAYEPIETYPESTYISKTYSPEKIEIMLGHLSPGDAIYFLLTPDQKDPKQYAAEEKWTKTPYSIEEIDLKSLDMLSLNENIKIPAPNPFIAKDFNIKYKGSVKPWNNDAVPEKIKDQPKGVLYFLQDKYYKVPQVYLSLEVKSPYVNYRIPKSAAMRDLWIKLFEEALAGPLYEAKLAGINFKVEEKEEGFRFLINGYNDKLLFFMKKIEEAAHLPHLTEKQFNLILSDLKREYRNFKLDSPVRQAIEFFKESVYVPYASNSAREMALKRVTFEKFQTFVKKVWEKSYTEGLAIGNLESKEVIPLWNEWLSSLGKNPYLLKDHKNEKVIELSQKKGPFKKIKKIDAKGNGFLLGIESETFSAKERGIQQMLQQVVDKAFFKELRTRQQTGYLVGTTAEDLEKRLFTLFLIQSASYKPEELLWRVEAFLEQFLRDLPTSFTKEDFNTAKSSLILQMQERPKSLKDLGDLLTKIAFDFDGDFEWMNKRVQSLKSLTYEEFLEAAEKFFGRTNRRRLAIFTEGSEKQPFKYKPIFSEEK